MTTTWSTTDILNGSLSGGNLVFTSTATGMNAVRSADRVTSGKYYWEITGSPFAPTSGCVGIALGTWSLINSITGLGSNLNGGAGPWATCLSQNGAIYQNGTSITGAIFGSIASGTTICIAADFDNKLIWFRLGASGNWNANASYAPGGSGGFSFPGGPGFDYYAITQGPGTSGVVTANFGASTFVGTVPSGYTSGFPSGTTAVDNAVETIIALEQWSGTGPAQVTQIALEQWGTGPIGTRAIVTAIALEEWATVAQLQLTGGSAWLLGI